jgi:nitrogen fixation protein FixH
MTTLTQATGTSWCSNAENDMQSNDVRKPRRFTGYHMTMILVVFFAIVIAVNVVMARFAIDTFGGTVVDNSYVASQKFNGWLRQARREKAMGWTVSSPAREQDHIVISAKNAAGSPLAGAAVTMLAEHPLGRAPERTLRFLETAPGRYAQPRTAPRRALEAAHSRRSGKARAGSRLRGLLR